MLLNKFYFGITDKELEVPIGYQIYRFLVHDRCIKIYLIHLFISDHLITSDKSSWRRDASDSLEIAFKRPGIVSKTLYN